MFNFKPNATLFTLTCLYYEKLYDVILHLLFILFSPPLLLIPLSFMLGGADEAASPAARTLGRPAAW